jgi:1-phosphofructokinase family hexose kinase
VIVTVSPNIALDRVAVVQGFRPGQTSRAIRSFTQAGGSGVHASQVVQQLGGQTIALGLAGGPTGELWHRAAQRQNIPYDVIPIEGETRESYCMIDQELGSVVESVEAGPRVAATHLGQLLERLERHLPTATLLIVSGSLPPGMPDDAYAQMIELARRYHIPTLADIHSEPLRQALPSRPWLIKPNLAEFHQLLGRETVTLPERAAASRDLQGAAAEVIALSMDKAGLLLTGPAGQWLLRPPTTAVHLPEGAGLNTIGCGDALIGAMAFQFGQTGDLINAAKLGLAAAHANLGTYGVPEIDPALVWQLSRQVTVDAL